MIERPDDQREVGVELETEMRKAYLDYAMTVIVARALPDVRDGLKPVQRRILWTMHEMGLRSDRPFRKSAAIVGDVMGKYHPHGDVPIYDALARFAQDFTMRYPPIQGQGNFGCFSGDTKVELVNGEQKTFVELVEMVHRGVRAEVFTLDAHRNVRIKPLRAPRLVKRNDPVVKVTLASGAEIVCTPDHRFMMRDGTYREAGKLKEKDKLMPFARTAIPERLHRTGAFPIPASLAQSVASVAPAGRADVYDLTVDVTQNFALAAGVFVHNSIDDDPCEQALPLGHASHPSPANARGLRADRDEEPPCPDPPVRGGRTAARVEAPPRDGSRRPSRAPAHVGDRGYQGAHPARACAGDSGRGHGLGGMGVRGTRRVQQSRRELFRGRDRGL